MSEPKLVRVSIYENGDERRLGYAWGWLTDTDSEDNFFFVYTRSKRVSDELAVGSKCDLYRMEVDTAVAVENCWTPNIVYVNAARYALVGEIKDA